MKRVLAKVLALALALILTVGVFACKTETPAVTPETDAPDTATDAPAGEEVPVEEATETYRIGLLLNVTGWFAAYDMHALHEVEAIVEVINDQGGWEIGGKKYKLEYVLSDLQSDFANIGNAAMYLIDEGVDIVLETNDFFVAGAQPLWEQYGIMHINKATTMDPNWGGADNPHAFTAGTNGTVMQWVEALEMTKAYFPETQKIVYFENDTGSNAHIYDYICSLVGGYGLEAVASVLYPGTDPDMAAFALQLVNSGADAVVCAGTVNNIAALLKEIRSLGSDMPVIASGSLYAADILKLAGEDAAYNFASTAYDRDPAVNTEIYNLTYQKMVEQKGEEVAATFNGPSANVIYVLLNVMSIAGTTDVDAVMETWVAQTEIPSLYGTAYMGGAETYGLPNHAVGVPSGRMLMTKEGTTYERVEVRIP